MIIRINTAYPCSHGDCSHQPLTNSLFPRRLFTSTCHTKSLFLQRLFMSSMRLQTTPRSQQHVVPHPNLRSLPSMIVQLCQKFVKLAIHHFIPHLNPNSLRPALLSNIVGVHVSFILDQCLRERIIPRSSPWSPRVDQKTPRYIGPNRSIVVHVSSQIFIQQSQPKGSRRCLQKIVRFRRFG